MKAIESETLWGRASGCLNNPSRWFRYLLTFKDFSRFKSQQQKSFCLIIQSTLFLGSPLHLVLSCIPSYQGIYSSHLQSTPRSKFIYLLGGKQACVGWPEPWDLFQEASHNSEVNYDSTFKTSYYLHDCHRRQKLWSSGLSGAGLTGSPIPKHTPELLCRFASYLSHASVGEKQGSHLGHSFLTLDFLGRIMSMFVV